MAVYQQPGLVLQRGTTASPDVVRALQRDLRALGYLRAGTDGQFGAGTEVAVRALQFDLMHNDGKGSDGDAPVVLRDLNGGAVTAVTGVVDPVLAGCIARLIDSPDFPKLPDCDDPAAANAQALSAIAASHSTVAPVPFIAAIVRQESGGRHFAVPSGGNDDNFVTVGLDRNAGPDAITSRGYGIGQYTLFHHPPRADEIHDFMLDPVRNVQKAQNELRDKFDHFVAGPTDRADERQAEHPLLPLRPCRYAPSDARYMRDCTACANGVRKLRITSGTPWFAGAKGQYEPTQYHPYDHYDDVPDRAEFLCDWPYAVRRYNGSGVNSFHYQTEVLQRLATLPPG